MGRTIAVANQKGGVGKSTTAINLSACLAEQGKKVLTIDMDPQGNTTSGLGVDKNAVENTLYELLVGQSDIEATIVKNAVENVDLIPSNVNLSGAEIELVRIDNKEYMDEVFEVSKYARIVGLPNESFIRVKDNDIDFVGKHYFIENGVME